MTREEYERLLKSDYWKGFSYSLIKERNFTCQDCGRSFYNERNKLQVHHLVYRDIYPWSYRPDELVVLCEECHKRRHGIISDPMTNTDSTKSETSSGYNKTYSYSTDVKDEHSMHSDERQRYNNQYNTNNHHTIYPSPHNNPIKLRHIFFGIFIILFVLYFVSSWPDDKTIDNKENIEKTTIQNVDENFNNDSPSNVVIKENKNKRQNQNKNRGKNVKSGKNIADKNSAPKDKTRESTSVQQEDNQVLSEPIQSSNSELEHSSAEIIGNVNTEIENEEIVTKRSSTEASTEEINDRIYRAHVIENAKRVGVSTEGTTSEINDRIYRAHVIENAKRAGVSTEGTTSEINDRIYRAHVIENAKRAGVSTEGTTSEINDRIYRAHVIENAKRAGVSTEGTTEEINDRIYEKHRKNNR